MRVHRQRPGDRHPLLLAAGEPVRVLVELVGEADPLQQRRRLRPASSAPRSSTVSLGERHVLERGLVGEEVELLEDHPDPPADVSRAPVVLVALAAPGRCSRALEQDPPAVGRLEEVDAAQQRALAGAARPEHADDLALRPRGRSRAAPPGRRSSCRRPRACSIGSAIRSALRSARCRAPAGRLGTSAAFAADALLLAGDQPVDEPRQRDRSTTRNRIAPSVSAELLKVSDWMSRPAWTTSIERDHADQRGVLHQRDEVVEQRRDHLAHRLGHDHVAHRLAVAHAERARRLHLAAGTASIPAR